MKENSFSREKKQTEINIADLFFYLLYHWKWYVVSLLLCIGVGYLRFLKTEKMYSSSLNVYLKNSSGNSTPVGSSSTVGLGKYKENVNGVDLSDEIMKLQSKSLLRQAVLRIHGDISYKIKEGFSPIELYKQSPVSVCFLNTSEKYSASFVVKLKDYRTVELSEFGGQDGKALTATMNERIKTPIGSIVLRPTKYCRPGMFGVPIQVTKYSLNDAARVYHNNMTIKQNMDESSNPTSVLTIMMHDACASRAQDMLTMLLAVYNENAKLEKNRVVSNTARFIKNRIDIIGRELNGVESSLASFQSSNKVWDINSSAGMYMGQSQKYTQNIEDMESQLHLVEYMKAYLNSPEKASELIPSNMGIKDMDIESQISQYNALKLRRDKLIEEDNDHNPVVLDLNKTLQALRKSILRTVENVISGLTMQNNEAAGRDARTQAKVATLPMKQKEYLSIERQQKIKDELYTYLLNKREENALMQAMIDDNAQIIDASDNDFSPISPNRTKNMAFALLLGLFIPTMILLIKMLTDTKVRNRKDVEEGVSVPFLGAIPKSEGSKNTMEENEYGIVAEAFRVLRTNIAFLLKNKKEAHIITVSSFNESSGKTFVVTRLAKSLMMNKKRVLLIDLDIRKGTLSRLCGLGKPGMTDFLVDDTLTVEDIIHRKVKDQNTPDMIGAGTIAPNPAELLMSHRLDELIKEVNAQYDYIVVDSVPVGMVADAAIIDRIVDLTLFVIRAGRFDRRQLPDVEQLFDRKKLTNMGIILNDVKLEHNGYGYGYGHTHGYGYGYGEDRKKTLWSLLRFKK